MEVHNIKSAFLPVDMNTAAITGDRVSMAGADRVAIMIHMGDSTAATVQFTLRQHNAATAGTSKDLSVDNVYYKKAGTATSFTKVSPVAAAALYDVGTDFASQEGVVVFEVLSEQLDNDNGFNWVSVDAADSAAAKLGSAVYILRNVRNMPAYDSAL